MFCRNCGANNADNAAFCINCGAAMAEEQPAQQPVQQPVYQQPVYQQPVQQPAYQQPAYQQPVYQQPVYQQPAYQQPAVKPAIPGKGMGVTGMVLGIVSLALFCVWYLAIPCAIVGMILSGIAAKKAKEVGMKNGMATAGIVCSAIALGITVLFIILVAVGVAGALSLGGGYYY